METCADWSLLTTPTTTTCTSDCTKPGPSYVGLRQLLNVGVLNDPGLVGSRQLLATAECWCFELVSLRQLLATAECWCLELVGSRLPLAATECWCFEQCNPAHCRHTRVWNVKSASVLQALGSDTGVWNLTAMLQTLGFGTRLACCRHWGLEPDCHVVWNLTAMLQTLGFGT